MPKFRTAMPIRELADKNKVSRRERAVERRREQEGTTGGQQAKSPQTPAN